jgi:hypothetical protein
MMGRSQPNRHGAAKSFDEFRAELAIEQWRAAEPWVGPNCSDLVPDEPDLLSVDSQEE